MVNAFELDPEPFELFRQFQKMGNTPGDTVQLPHDYRIPFPKLTYHQIEFVPHLPGTGRNVLLNVLVGNTFL